MNWDSVDLIPSVLWLHILNAVFYITQGLNQAGSYCCSSALHAEGSNAFFSISLLLLPNCLRPGAHRVRISLCVFWELCKPEFLSFNENICNLFIPSSGTITGFVGMCKASNLRDTTHQQLKIKKYKAFVMAEQAEKSRYNQPGFSLTPGMSQV